MYATLYNQARILYCLEPLTGLLIKSGKESFDPTRPEMEFIRTWAEVEGVVLEVPFLPGSSIKGVVRSHAERVLRALRPASPEKAACDPTGRIGSCVPDKKGQKTGGQHKAPHYREHCLACRTFGRTTLAGRVRFTDAFPWKPEDDPTSRKRQMGEIAFQQRPGVRINRRTGTADGGAFYEIETITSGRFYGEITLRNFQLWQMGLLALVLRDIDEGHQRIGAMKSRGLGRVKLKVEELRIDQYGTLVQPDSVRIRGVGDEPGLVAQYDLVSEDAVDRPEAFETVGDAVLRQCFKPGNGSADTAWKDLADAILRSPHWRGLMQQAKGEQE